MFLCHYICLIFPLENWEYYRMPGSMFPFGKDSKDKKEKREPNGWDIMSVVINLIHVCAH